VNNQNAEAWDVIVIGSGPAGSAAAAICRKAGLNVLIVTQAAKPDASATIFPGSLESIHPGVSSLLEKIGAEGAEQLASLATYDGIYAGDTYTPLGEDVNGTWQGLHIHRQLFNTQLLLMIGASGVTIRCNQTIENFILEQDRIVGIKTGSGELIYATHLIDASGKKAIAGKKLNLKRKFFSPPLLCWTGISGGISSYPVDPHAAHFISGQEEWTWLAPNPPDQCAWTRLSMRGEKSLLPPDLLKQYPIVGEVQAHNMRWRMYHPVCREGIILCGDAAGILDPAAGQGILNALWSGIMAANTVVSCLQNPAYEAFHLARYNHWFEEQFELKVSQLRAYYITHGLSGLTAKM